jgi:hypothetical protein
MNRDRSHASKPLATKMHPRERLSAIVIRLSDVVVSLSSVNLQAKAEKIASRMRRNARRRL